MYFPEEKQFNLIRTEKVVVSICLGFVKKKKGYCLIFNSDNEMIKLMK